MIIKKSEYELLKKAVATNDEYVKLIKINNQELANLSDSTMNLSNEIKITLEKLHLIEMARRTNAGKAGALTNHYNKEKIKNKELEQRVSELEAAVELKELELEKKETELKIQKNNGKKKQMDDYKKLEELTKDIEKHKRK